MTKKKLTSKTSWQYGMGQLGWALLAAIVTSQLTSIWTGFDDANTKWDGFLPVTIFSVIFMVSKVFDAISDPIVGFFSDRLRSKWGRRIPFMFVATLPFAIVSVLVFMGISHSQSIGAIVANSIMLTIMIIAFYVFLTLYTIPYTSLITDLSSKAEDRVNLSMIIAITYFIGSLLAYGAPTLWSMIHESGVSLGNSIIITMVVFSIIAMIFLFIPVFTIKERDYIQLSKKEESVKKESFSQVIKDVFRFRKFRWFILADFLYWIGLIIFQSQVNAIISSILGIELKNAIFFVGTMGIVSFLLYGPISIMLNKAGVRKKFVQVSFALFFILFSLGAIMITNRDQAGEALAWIEGLIFVAIAGVPMAVLGVVENVIVSDVINYADIVKNEDKAASFYAVRNLTMKMGQAIGMGFGTLFLILGKTQSNPLGVRLMLAFAGVTSILGFVAMFFYEEIRYRGTKEIHKITNLRNKINYLEDPTKKFKNKINKINEKIKEFEELKKVTISEKAPKYEKELVYIEKVISEYKNDLEKIKNKAASLKQKISEDPKTKELLKEYNEKISMYETLGKEKADKYTKNKINNLNEKLSKLEESLADNKKQESIKIKLDKFTEWINSSSYQEKIDKKIQKLKANIQKLNDSKPSGEKKKTLEDKINAIKINIKSETSEFKKSILEDQILKIQEKITHDKKLKKLNNEIIELEKTKETPFIKKTIENHNVKLNFGNKKAIIFDELQTYNKLRELYCGAK